MSDNVQPIFILPEDTKRTSGKDAQRNNIAAAKAVAQTVRTTLGPKGMDKMLVDSMGEVVITNDGATILKEMQIEHPAAKMIVEVAKTQEDTVGDGTTTAVILAGELLKRAEDLLDQNIHPTVLARGYRLAEAEAQRLLRTLGESISPTDASALQQLALTAMTGKVAEANKEALAPLIVRAVTLIANGNDVAAKDIKVQTRIGERASQSELIEGIVLDKERVHPAMPTTAAMAKVALLDASLEIKNTEIDAKIQITDPEQLNSFLAQEEQILQMMVENIKASQATVLFCQKGIDDLAQHFLARAGILAVRRVRRSDMDLLSRATGARIVSNWKELSPKDLGTAGRVYEEMVGEEPMLFVTGCAHPKAATILVKGGTTHVAEEIKRAVIDAIGDLAAALKEGKIVGGAGAVEIEVARQLRLYAKSLSGREQLAALAFAEALEIVPRTLAENAGLDPLDILARLRSAHDQGQRWAGLNVFSGEVIDTLHVGIIEPLKVKTQALSSATDVAEMILRIDDVILGGAGKNSLPSSPVYGGE